MEELVQEENWTEILRQFDIAVPTEIPSTCDLPEFDPKEKYYIYIIVEREPLANASSKEQQKRSIVKWGIALNLSLRFYMMQERSGSNAYKFDTPQYGIMRVKTIEWSDVEALNNRYITSTYELALMCEWLLEAMRLSFSPFTHQAIAGTGSILNGLFLRESKSSALEMQRLRAELAAAIVTTLNEKKFVVPSSTKRNDDKWGGEPEIGADGQEMHGNDDDNGAD